MGSRGFGKRKNRRPGNVRCAHEERRCRCLFLDSGAHSLYNLWSLGKNQKTRFNDYWTGTRFTDKFKEYMDQYANFVLANKKGIDLYVTVDVIYSPELSWLSLKYLEDKGLKPVPVIHARTPLKWLDKYLDAGYQLLGVGGLGQESSRFTYAKWADQFFSRICPASNGYKPIVRTHGFAMTSYGLIVRYPWWSVDSVSWAKAGGFGSILIPHKRNGEFTFAENPYVIGASCDSVARKLKNKHYMNLAPGLKAIVDEWLEKIDVPLGRIDDEKRTLEYGVLSEYHARAVANLRFFEAMVDWLPKWPWSFKPKPIRGFF